MARISSDGDPPRPEVSETELPFDPMSLDFERGVEFGLAHARLADYGRVEMVMHADMAEMVIRLAESRGGLPFSATPHVHDERCEECTGRSDCKDGSEWLDVTIGSTASWLRSWRG
jgi:hypothetical protein